MTYCSISNFLKKNSLFVLFAVLVAACASPPEYPDTPAIEFLSMSKDTLQRGSFFNDTTFVKFSFTDGDGDIGDEDSLQLVVTDSRNNFENEFRIPFVPEFGDSGLKGEITVRLFTSCCIFPDSLYLEGCTDVLASMPYDEVTFDIYIKDRKGHESNTITTTPVYIRCFD
jgi:hypothetical protein